MCNGNIAHGDGKASDLWLVGSVVYLQVTVVVNLQAVLETCSLGIFTAVGVAFSFCCWAFFQAALSGSLTGSVMSPELHGSTSRILGSPTVVLSILVTTGLTLLADVQCKGVRCCCFPTALHVVQAKLLEEDQEKRLLGHTKIRPALEEAVQCKPEATV
eukprot:CAMPEP_0180700798 /NCGR_PEP_ID=MMETSP1038_2-20121128/5265_1 /TAXON_ID=632150 /ORGANISM="Azadinium spinosum, Strain 3D9" /LENGTH=158 /DNA_ID=CAMNT_0022732489 /DNA_START=66 /DNA_END=542 /DNA_ORIENTATION=-